MCTIAIDCGATFLKACRMNEITGQIERTLINKTPCADGAMTMLEKSVQLIREVIIDLVGVETQAKIGFSTEMHGFVVTDSHGHPFLDYISWQDESAYRPYLDTTYLDYVRSSLDPEDITNTGMPLKAGLPSVNLFYYLNTKLKEVPRDEMYFYTLGDYYLRILAGAEPLIHCTNAAGTGLFDVRANTWNWRILSRLGMQDLHFPAVYTDQPPIETMLGNVKLSFYPAIGDQQAALLGANFLDVNGLSVNLGTGGQISVLSRELLFSYQYQTRPYFLGNWLLTIPHIPSGRALNVYFRFLYLTIRHFADIEEEELWNYLQDEADRRRTDRSDGDLTPLRMDMSFFTNALTDHTRGEIGGITEQNLTPGNLFYSAYSQMAEGIARLRLRFGARNVTSISYSGGVARKNPMLRDMITERFPEVRTIQVADNETLKGIREFVKEVDGGVQRRGQHL